MANTDSPFPVSMPEPDPNAPPKKTRKVVVQPIQYKVGKDITSDDYNTLVMKVADWFAERKPGLREPVKVAKRYVDCAMKGTKPREPDKAWSGAERWGLAQRIRSACAFDMDTLKPIYKKSERRKIRREKDQQRAKAARAAKQVDPYTPEAVRVLGRQQAVYGDDPAIFLSRKEHERWLTLRQQYMDQFPELGLVNAEAELNVLCDLLVLAERHRLKMLNGEKLATRDYQGLIDTIDSIKQTLGIHPNQLAKRQSDRRAGSFADLLARYESLDNARELREKHWIEELIQIYQMYHQPSPRTDMGGYQLDEVGLLGLTGCRTCKCAGCGVQNYAGLDIKEIERYLEAKRVLEVEDEPAQAVESGLPRTDDEAEEYAKDPHSDVKEAWDKQFRDMLVEERLLNPDAPDEDEA